MGSRYSEAFIEQALFKVYSRGKRTIKSVAEELNVKCHTVKNGMNRKEIGSGVSPVKEKRPQDWTPEQQLIALHQTHGLSGEALQRWCREHGLFAHHLTSWKTAFCAGAKAASGSQEIRVLKDMDSGACQDRACTVISLSERTLQRWQIDQSRGDQRPKRTQTPSNRLDLDERKKVLTVVNSEEFGSLPPSQIVPILADRGKYIASESTFHRIMREKNQLRQV